VRERTVNRTSDRLPGKLGVACGPSRGAPVMEDYPSPFRVTGTVKRALVDVTGLEVLPRRDVELALAVQAGESPARSEGDRPHSRERSPEG